VHIAQRSGIGFIGTARYGSIWAHLGEQQSRRDDLESLAYMLIYFCRGSLPWQGLRGATKNDKYGPIRDEKRSTSIAQLCVGLPDEFSLFLKHARFLRFDEKPDYAYLRGLFHGLYDRMGYEYDQVFDWTTVT
jgi:hypothetical protein